MGLEDMIQNATPWKYPRELHEQLCRELRINPRVYIVPGWTKRLFVEHFRSDDDDTDAFADDGGNVVYFYEDYWTKEYKLWLIHHEMFHQSQFYDNGNGRDRWAHLGINEQVDVWEREAEEFANLRVGLLGKKVKRYTREPDNLINPRFSDRYLKKAQEDGGPRLQLGGRRRRLKYTWNS